jgi:exodeoxyribonuclease-5
MSIELNNEQIYAVYDMEKWWNSSTEQLFQISGASGTGKSTLVNYLIERIGLDYKEVLFLAFMGKAASRLARNGLPARTIHSTIYDYEKVLARDDDGKIIFRENGKPKLVSKFIKKDHLDKKIKLIVVDEGSMVDEHTAMDLMSFGIPIIVLGDLNQLPPVFGKSFFLRNPDVILTQIMRQSEGNPIIWLSQEILAGNKLKTGVYGNSAVINKQDLTEFYFRNSDIILTCTNRLRYNINKYVREDLKQIKKLDYPHIGEKVMCRKNNWDKCIDGNIYMTNGTTGFVDNVYRDSFNGKTMTIDFRPDFTNKCFKNVTFDYQHLYEIPGQEPEEKTFTDIFNDKIEFAYAITTHSSQGSEWNKVLYLAENIMRNKEDEKRLNYTAITRASESIIIVV